MDIQQEILKVAEEIAGLYRAKVKESAFDLGGLYYGIQVDKEGCYYDKENYVCKISIKLVDYWHFVEFGRRQGKGLPPKDGSWDYLAEWTTRHLPGVTWDSVPNARQVAFLVNRKIKDKGIDPKPIMTESVGTPIPANGDYKNATEWIIKECKPAVKQKLDKLEELIMNSLADEINKEMEKII